jgi:hypothetical protein
MLTHRKTVVALRENCYFSMSIQSRTFQPYVTENLEACAPPHSPKPLILGTNRSTELSRCGFRPVQEEVVPHQYP